MQGFHTYLRGGGEMAISRREFLKISGGALAGAVTGCVTPGRVSEKAAAVQGYHPNLPTSSSTMETSSP